MGGDSGVVVSRSRKPYQGSIMAHPMRRSSIRFHRRWWPGWERVEDDGRGVIENLCESLLKALEIAYVHDQEWAVMAQDDAKPVPDLLHYLHEPLARCPTSVASFYSCRPKVDPRLLEKGERWYVHPTRKEGPYIVLFAMRRELVNDAVAGIRSVLAEPYADRCLQTWLQRMSIPSATHIPNLAQHIGRVSVRGNPWKVMGIPRVSPTFPEGLDMRAVLKRFPYPKDTE